MAESINNKEEHYKGIIKDMLGLDSISEVSELIRNQGVDVANSTTHYIRILKTPNIAKVWFLKDHIEIFINDTVYENIKDNIELNIAAQPRKKFVAEGLNHTIICETKGEFLCALQTFSKLCM